MAHMLATYVNCIAVIAGTLLGVLLRRWIKASYQDIVIGSTGFVTAVIALGMAMKSASYLTMVCSVVLGGFLGTALHIEDRVLHLGVRLQKLTSGRGEASGFATGFLSASVLFCTGAMAIVGSIQAGTSHDYQLLLVKSVMDGCMSVAFGATYGPGVAFSALSLLLYQGFFTLFGGWLQPCLGDAGINEMGAVGGVLLLMVSCNLLGLRKTKAGDYLPAIVLAPLVGRVFARF